jgi:predicted nucleic acid-binding protein
MNATLPSIQSCSEKSVSASCFCQKVNAEHDWSNGSQGVQRIHCLGWEADTGLQWAALLAGLRAAGKSMPIKDSMIAASALTHNLTVVTRNTADFKKAAVPVLDPFAAKFTS